MIKLFRIILAALLICTLTLSYQGISQKPGGSVIKTERAGLSGNCSEAKEEKFSWKDITLIVFGIGIIVLIIINAFLYYRIKRYKERGFYQGHSDAVAVENEEPWKEIGKSEQERDQLLQIPDAVAVENEEEPWKELGKRKQKRDQFLQTPDAVVVENEVLRNKLGELQNEIDKRKAQYKHAWRNVPLYPDWRKEEFKAVNMTLDAATAHPALLLSEEGRQVSWQERCQEIPSSSERFSSIPCVLGQLCIISGRYSWDIEVGDACSWDLGVCRDNVTRKGRVTMSPKNGFWAIRFYEGEYWALTSPETRLILREKPVIVRVFLDYEAGDVSFYNMTDESHIFTFPQNPFYGVLKPLFRLWFPDSGPLTIVEVE